MFPENRDTNHNLIHVYKHLIYVYIQTFFFPQIPKTHELSSGADNYSDSQSPPISFDLNVLSLGLSDPMISAAPGTIMV